ncbi:hypothetical protein FJZ48_04100 [Candidatus Uhrbacteria bacterium]|nr:hypothetical protein [Candidatus Uhrbacteria bacterium]
MIAIAQPTIPQGLENLEKSNNETLLSAQREVEIDPNSIAAWKNLAEVYRGIKYPDEQDFWVSPPFAREGWRKAKHKALELEFGTLTKPRTLQEAVKLATAYSDGWAEPCAGPTCDDRPELDLYQQVISHAQTQSWDFSLPAERSAQAELNFKHAEWQRIRTDLFPLVKASTSTSVTPMQHTVPNLQYYFIGAIVLACLLLVAVLTTARRSG